MKVRQARASITIHEGVGNRMIPALVPVHIITYYVTNQTNSQNAGAPGEKDTVALRPHGALTEAGRVSKDIAGR